MQGHESLDTWFRSEILCHEKPFMQFLARLWPHRDELEDIRQESYSRVYQAALRARPEIPKAFLFATARHLLVDWRRRGKIVIFCGGANEAYQDTLVDQISPEQQILANIELAQLNRAILRLTPKCREVVWMRRVQGLSQREVAERLGVSEKMIEKHLHLGMRRLGEWVRS
jgi:RNA polymerase sigma factor (sigma-70 family)